MSEIEYLIGREEWSNKPFRTQVFLATHDEADQRLPHRERSFISFTYGGKYIEDFNLIATIASDRMERLLYGNFGDNTSSSNIIDGQFYWGTHFTTNQLALLLSTDEITEEELEDFKHWFVPGEGKELILAEHPNRAIWARISSPPVYHVIPFEKRIQKKLAGNWYEISTTVYRGNIDLNFVMDDPFWYSIYNVLPSYAYDLNDNFLKILGLDLINSGDKLQQALNNSLMAHKDYLKVIFEDLIPTREMIRSNNNIFLGDELILSNDDLTAENSTTIPATLGVNVKDFYGVDTYGSVVNESTIGSEIGGVIPVTNNDITAPSAYLYYAGTAAAPTIVSFNLTPIIIQLPENSVPYIVYPKNQIYENSIRLNALSENIINTTQYYNTLKVGDTEFKFTTPSLLTGYNLALQIVSNIIDNFSTIDLALLLNEGVNEYYSRQWALGVLQYIKFFSSAVDLKTSLITNATNFIRLFNKFMSLMLKLINPETNQVDLILPVSFLFNSKTGVSTGKFRIRCFKDNILDNWEKLSQYTGDWHVSLFVDSSRDFVKISEESLDEYFVQIILGDNFDLVNLSESEYLWILTNLGMKIYDENDEYITTLHPFLQYTEEREIKENVGDMVYSKYLYLLQRNKYNEEGFITELECTPIYTDCILSDLNIRYKHMYL